MTSYLRDLKAFLDELDANGRSDLLLVGECEILSCSDLRSAVAEIERLREAEQRHRWAEPWDKQGNTFASRFKKWVNDGACLLGLHDWFKVDGNSRLCGRCHTRQSKD